MDYNSMNAVFTSRNSVISVFESNQIWKPIQKTHPLELEDSILSEDSQVQKAKGRMFSLICGI
jgi:hypothetical protein